MSYLEVDGEPVTWMSDGEGGLIGAAVVLPSGELLSWRASENTDPKYRCFCNHGTPVQEDDNAWVCGWCKALHIKSPSESPTNR